MVESSPNVHPRINKASYTHTTEYHKREYHPIIKRNEVGVLFRPPSDAYVRSFLYLLYTLIKLYYTHTHAHTHKRNEVLTHATMWMNLQTMMLNETCDFIYIKPPGLFTLIIYK